MPDDSLPLLFNQVTARPIKRTFSDAEVTAPQAAATAPVAAPAKRTFSDAEVSAPQPAAPPQSTASHAVKSMMSSLFETPPEPTPLRIPAYDPRTGQPLAPEPGRTTAAGPTVQAAQLAGETQGAPGPTYEAAATLPITDPSAGERFLAHGERAFESSL